MNRTLSPLAIFAVCVAVAGSAIAQTDYTTNQRTDSLTQPIDETTVGATDTEVGATDTDNDALPATAGSLPLLELGGLAALAAGLALRTRERP